MLDSSFAKRSLIARGRTAELYSWEEGRVLKLFYNWCQAEWIDREIMANAELASGQLPIPHLFGTVDIEDRRGLIFERVDGKSMLSQLQSKPWQVVNIARKFAGLQVEMHKIRASRLPDLRAALRHTIERVEKLSETQKAAVLEKLELLPDGDCLCHFDFHPDQVLISASGPVVIDWLTAFRGAPAADVARSSIILAFARAPYLKGPQATLLALFQKLFYSLYRRQYFKLNPAVNESEVRAWMLPVAAGRLQENIEGEEKRLLNFIARELAQE